MWFIILCLTTLLCAALCMLPGYLLARLVGLPRPWALVTSPIVGIAEIGILGEVYSLAHVPSSPVTIMVPLLALPVLGLVLTRKHPRHVELPGISPILLVAYLGVGMVASYFLFVSHLFTYWSVYQSPDTPFHLNEIRAFADSGNFTVLNVNPYLGADALLNPHLGAGFYPTGWHSLCALLVQATGRQAAFAINTSVWFFTGVVYPLGILAFLSYIFPRNLRVQAAGSLMAPAFVLFPWTPLIFGPEYPNVAGFTALPATLVLFMLVVGDWGSRRAQLRTALLFLLACAGQALLHPNTLFTAVVILAPYCVDRIWRLAREKHGLPARRSLLCALGFVAFVLVVWTGLYLAPPLRGIVTFEWPSYAEPFQQLANTLGLSYDFMFSYEFAPQYVLAVLVIAGFVRCLYDGRHRWLALSYVLAVLILIVDASYADPFWRHFFAGFWYTDPIRIAAMCVLVAAPLAAYGAEWAYLLTVRLLRRYNAGSSRKTHPYVIAAVLAALFLLGNFLPNLYVPGSYVDYEHALENPDVSKSEPATAALKSLQGEPNLRTTFGNYSEYIDKQYGTTSPLTLKELAFLDKVAAYVSPGDVIINDPMDGSFLSYGTNDLRIYYRTLDGYGANEKPESVTIRERLCNISTDADVRDAVRSIGAKYVLVLDQQGSATSLVANRGLYLPLGFYGVSHVHDDTPGFEVALSDGALRLYRIVG